MSHQYPFQGHLALSLNPDQADSEMPLRTSGWNQALDELNSSTTFDPSRRGVLLGMASMAVAGLSACGGGGGGGGDHPAHELQAVVSTFAGIYSISGSTDGSGSSARFSGPSGLVFDASGQLYVADYIGDRIRKITPAGVVTTFAGSGVSGAINGTGLGASFRDPSGLAMDASGNLYVCDTTNHCIRKVNPDGVASTFAGVVDSYGSNDGTGTGAKFFGPIDIKMDPSGTLIVSDSGNHRIRKITLDGVVSTFAGSFQGQRDGLGVNAQFNKPRAIDIDIHGDLYVVDCDNHQIRKITPEGLVTTYAGSIQGHVDGSAMQARFNQPSGMALDAGGQIYVADNANSCIRKISTTGQVSTMAGRSWVRGGDDGTGTAATFGSPQHIIFDRSGNLFVSDFIANTIRKITFL